jgi:hypothetical protein
MKTQFTLNYWYPKTRKLGQNIERIYVNPENGQERPEALGYFEKSEIVRARDKDSDSYYERHRWIKGEDVAYDHKGVKWIGDEHIRDAICNAVFGDRKVGLKDNWKEALESDSWGFFRALQELSRGFNYQVSGKFSKDKETRARAREIEKSNQKRQSLVFAF